jgi:hypothetical protein
MDWSRKVSLVRLDRSEAIRAECGFDRVPIALFLPRTRLYLCHLILYLDNLRPGRRNWSIIWLGYSWSVQFARPGQLGIDAE